MDCIVCGKYFKRNHNCEKYCSEECRNIGTRERHKRNELNAKIRKRANSNHSLNDICALALKEHLTYGQYVAKYGI